MVPYSQRSRLLATFNGGFTYVDGNNGSADNGQTNEPLKIGKPDTRLGDSASTIILMNNASNLVQFIGGENNAGERDATADRAGPRARHCYRNLIAGGSAQNFCHFFCILREDGAFRMAVLYVTRVSQERLHLVGIGFNKHGLRMG